MIVESQLVRSPTSEDFEGNIRGILELMLSSERKGDYVEAQNLRIKAQNERERWEDFVKRDMNQRHSEQAQDAQTEYETRLMGCNQEFTNRLEDFMQSCRQQIKSIDQSNRNEISQLKNTLNQQLPTKVKETYQLLNLREMEHHMSKQKNFPQAHLIQGKIKLLYEQELAAWNNDRQAKIEQAVTNMKNKHAKERDLLNKRIQIQLEDINNEWHQQKIALLQRYNLTLKELRASQEREFLSFKREFKTKGGVFSNKFMETMPNDSSVSH